MLENELFRTGYQASSRALAREFVKARSREPPSAVVCFEDDSEDKAFESLGRTPTSADLDKLVSTRFPGFHLDDDLREAILKRQRLERNHTYAVRNALGRMVARRTGI